MKMLALRSGDLCLDVAPNLGGSIAGFYITQKNKRFDLMRPATSSITAKPPALSMSMFPMVPFANCIRDNRFVLDGKNYSGDSKRKGKVFNPATGEQSAEVKLATRSDANKAIELSLIHI